jgi:hypothetical protein
MGSSIATRGTILRTAEIATIHTNPKRKRGNDLTPSLALRVSVSLNRGQYSSPAAHGGGEIRPRCFFLEGLPICLGDLGQPLPVESLRRYSTRGHSDADRS